MDGLINDRTKKVHKLGARLPEPRPECGATRRVDHDDVRVIAVEQAVQADEADRCGRCFADAGGY